MSSALLQARAGGPVTLGRLTLLSHDGGPPASLHSRLAELARLPYVERVLALPELHQKANAEVPSSLSIRTRGAIVPEFTSVAINDGMGVVVTNLDEADLSPERIAAFFRAVSASSSAHPLDANRYSLSAAQLVRAVVQGGVAGIERYALDAGALDAMDSGGRSIVPGHAGSLTDVIPRELLRTPVGRCEMGLNFGGNHFLELQAVDTVEDGGVASRWGLAPRRVVVTYHLGPGPFAGTLLHYYSRRLALSRPRVPLFFLAKLLFHFAGGGRPGGRGSLARAWGLHFRRNGATAYAPQSEEGLRLRQALAMATNFGFVYRLATVAAIRDGLREVFSPSTSARLLCDLSHNSLEEERDADGGVWVARHNACRLAPDRPALIAGAHDVPSYLAVGLPGGPPELDSYDHGAGCLIEEMRGQGRLPPQRDATVRLWLDRGRRARVRSLEILPVRSPEPVSRVMDCYERCGRLARVARLRPLGTLKNQGAP